MWPIVKVHVRTFTCHVQTSKLITYDRPFVQLFQVSYDTVKTLRGVVGNVLKAQSIETLGGRGGGGSKCYKTNLEQSLNSASSSSLTSGSDQPKPEPKFTLYIQSGAPQR